MQKQPFLDKRIGKHDGFLKQTGMSFDCEEEGTDSLSLHPLRRVFAVGALFQVDLIEVLQHVKTLVSHFDLLADEAGLQGVHEESCTLLLVDAEKRVYDEVHVLSDIIQQKQNWFI